LTSSTAPGTIDQTGSLAFIATRPLTGTAAIFADFTSGSLTDPAGNLAQPLTDPADFARVFIEPLFFDGASTGRANIIFNNPVFTICDGTFDPAGTATLTTGVQSGVLAVFAGRGYAGHNQNTLSQRKCRIQFLAYAGASQFAMIADHHSLFEALTPLQDIHFDTFNREMRHCVTQTLAVSALHTIDKLHISGTCELPDINHVFTGALAETAGYPAGAHRFAAEPYILHNRFADTLRYVIHRYQAQHREGVLIIGECQSGITLLRLLRQLILFAHKILSHLPDRINPFFFFDRSRCKSHLFFFNRCATVGACRSSVPDLVTTFTADSQGPDKRTEQHKNSGQQQYLNIVKSSHA
jgi:hypothetical protein